MSDPLDPIRRRHTALADPSKKHSARFAVRACAERDVATLLAEVDRLRESVAELEATIVNERGEGEPPVPGWVATVVNIDDSSRSGRKVVRWIGPASSSVERTGTGWWMRAGVNPDPYKADQALLSGHSPTARAAMRAAVVPTPTEPTP